MLHPAKTTTRIRSHFAPDSPKLHLAFLDGIRGLSALYVTAYHLLAWNLPLASAPISIQVVSALFRFGHASVSIFIILSGFMLMLTVLSDPNQQLRGGFWGYIRRRSRRILPPYYAAMILSLIFLGISAQISPIATASTVASGFRVDTIVSHVFLIHNLNLAWSSSINFTHWSVATEFQIYLLLPLLFLPLYHRFGAFIMVLVGIIMGILPGFFSWGKDVYSACPWYIGLFAFGMLGAIWAHRIIEHPGENYQRLIAQISIGSLVITLVGFGIGGNGELLERFPLVIAYILQGAKDGGVGGIVVALLLYLTWVQVGGKRSIWAQRLLNFLSGKSAKFLATFSYSLYLTHAMIVSFCVLYLDRHSPIDITWQWLFRTFVGLPMAICFGYIFYLLFEAPTIKKRLQS